MAFIEAQIDNQDGFLNTRKVLYLKANRNNTTAVYLVDGSKVNVNMNLEELMAKIKAEG